MARKKKIAGEINFYKAMTVLGLLLAGVLTYAFFGSAPDLSNQPFHVPTAPKSECMTCHVVHTKNAPIIQMMFASWSNFLPSTPEVMSWAKATL